MTNMDMNATSDSQWKTVNTDGTDTWNSKDIVISNWSVSCGDVSKPYLDYMESGDIPLISMIRS